MPAIKPTIVAHRGLHTQAPENSLGAFIAAAEAGVPWVECDVWPSADDIAMVIHDEILDQTTSAIGEVGQQTYEQLKKLRISSLPEVVNYFTGAYGGNPSAMLVEIKPNNARFVRLVLNELSCYPHGWMIQSFHADNIYVAWADDPTIPAAYLVETPAELYDAAEEGWPVVHSYHAAIDQSVVHRLQSAGRKIGAWTVNEPNDIQRMIDLGIDMLITDEPSLAAQIIAGK